MCRFVDFLVTKKIRNPDELVRTDLVELEDLNFFEVANPDRNLLGANIIIAGENFHPDTLGGISLAAHVVYEI